MRKSEAPRDDWTNLFGSNSRCEILRLFFNHPGQIFYQREIMFEAGLRLQGAQRELANLTALKILERKESGNRVYYELNQESDLYSALQQIFSKRK